MIIEASLEPPGQATARALSRKETERLKSCEVVVERGLANFMEVGAALLEIRTSRLYRASHATFDDYCRQRWSMTRRNADRLVAAAAVAKSLVDEVGPIGLTSEAVVRPLVAVAPEQRPAVLAKAMEIGRGQPNAKDMQQAVETLVATKEKAQGRNEPTYRPSKGTIFARMAISQLERIDRNDSQRDEGCALVDAWLEKNWRTKGQPR